MTQMFFQKLTSTRNKKTAKRHQQVTNSAFDSSIAPRIGESSKGVFLPVKAVFLDLDGIKKYFIRGLYDKKGIKTQ